MITVQIYGGLGNQMFQYAAARALAEKLGTEVKIDLYATDFKLYKPRPYALNLFKINTRRAGQKEVPYFNVPSKNIFLRAVKYFMRQNKITLKKYYFEKEFRFNKEFLRLDDEYYLHGVFQSEKYFKDIRGIIKKEFKFRKKMDKKNLGLLKQMTDCNSVSIHFRKGDYVKDKTNQETYVDCSIDYYKKAVDVISRKVKKPIFFVFSDDIDWVKQNFKIKHKMIFVHNSGKDSHKDMMLMSICKHNIIANSTFGWWGAWLNKNSKKIVIAPSKWFIKTESPDVIPEDWIKIVPN